MLLTKNKDVVHHMNTTYNTKIHTCTRVHVCVQIYVPHKSGFGLGSCWLQKIMDLRYMYPSVFSRLGNMVHLHSAVMFDGFRRVSTLPLNSSQVLVGRPPM